MLKRTAQTTRRKRRDKSEKPLHVASLRTARAKMMAARFKRTYGTHKVPFLGKDSDKALRKLCLDLQSIGTTVKEKIDKKLPRLCLEEFPGPPEIFDLSETCEFQRRAFEIFSAYDFAVVQLESAWLHKVLPYGEHASKVENCEVRIYETLKCIAGLGV
jgi:hypothetical protein